MSAQYTYTTVRVWWYEIIIIIQRKHTAGRGLGKAIHRVATNCRVLEFINGNFKALTVATNINGT